MPNVSVTLRSTSLPLVRMRTTDRNGAFLFEDLPAGLYSLEAAGKGIPETVLSPVIVVPGLPVIEHLSVPTSVATPRRS